MAEFLVNFSAKRYHLNPPWEECNTDQAGMDKQIRTEEQMQSDEYKDFVFCKYCKTKPRSWKKPRS
jgi:hypothetical protein